MAITTHASNGVIITSSALCITAPAQCCAGASQIIISICTACTPAAHFQGNDNGNTESCASYVDRLILIRKGTCTEETRYVSGESNASCNMVLCVHEAWCTPPAACDSIDVSYILQDAATVNGLGVINKRVQDYTSTRRFQVGNGTCFAYFALLNGASLETVDNSSTTVADIVVNNNGRLSNGFISNGAGAGGGYLIGTPAVAGELVFDAQCGAQLDFSDPLFFTMVEAPEVEIAGACTTGTVKMKNVFGTRQMRITAPGVTYSCLNIVGKDHACDSIQLNSCINAQTYTFTNVELDSARINFGACCTCSYSQTLNITNLNVKRAPSTGLLIDAVTNGGVFTSTINITNPKWSVSSSDFALDTACSVITERFKQNITVQDGTCKVSCSIINHISTRSSTAGIRVTTTSNACGVAEVDAESNRWTGTSETLAASTNHGLQVHNYAETSFATVPTLDNKINGFGQCLTVAVSTDPFVCEATEATALADGSTKVTICESACIPHSIIKYTCGTGTLTPGKFLGVCNGVCCPTVYGFVKEIIEGDSTAGTVVLTSRTGATYTSSLQEYDGIACAYAKGDWSATLTACSQQCFTYLMCAGQISCSPRTAQQLYDSMKAKLHQCPIDTADNWDDVKVWGRGEHPHPITGCGVKFKTENIGGEFSGVQQLNGCFTTTLNTNASCVSPVVYNEVPSACVSNYVGVVAVGVWLKKTGSPTGKIRGIATDSCCVGFGAPLNASINNICVSSLTCTYQKFCFNFCPPINASDLSGCVGGDIGIEVFCTHSLSACNTVCVERNNTNSTCEYAGYNLNGGCSSPTALPNSSEVKMSFSTNRHGWVITGLNNLGGISQFTEDDGTAFNPASSVPITITVKDCLGAVVNGMNMSLFTQPRCPGDTALTCGTTNACGVFNTNITVGGDVCVDLVIRKKGYINNVSGQTVDSCNGLVTGITVIKDRIVNLP